jgi:hypothetical protein
MSWNRGHSIALLLAASSLGIRSVTETPDAIVVEYGDHSPPLAPSFHLEPAARYRPERGPKARRRFPIRR